MAVSVAYATATGNLLSRVADVGGGHLNAAQHFTYNGFGQILTTIDPIGTVTQYGYDAMDLRGFTIYAIYARFTVTVHFIALTEATGRGDDGAWPVLPGSLFPVCRIT